MTPQPPTAIVTQSKVTLRANGAPPSATVTLARAVGNAPPAYITRDQVRAMVAVCETTRDRLLVETLWQSGGRVSEVANLRLCDIDRDEGALQLTNLKQRGTRRHVKLVYLSHDLIGALIAFARDGRLQRMDFLFQGRQHTGQHLTRFRLRRILMDASRIAGVQVIGRDGPRLATPLDFRHGAAVHLLRSGVPITEVQSHLGHARIDTTTIYTRLTDSERRRIRDGVTW